MNQITVSYLETYASPDIFSSFMSKAIPKNLKILHLQSNGAALTQDKFEPYIPAIKSIGGRVTDLIEIYWTHLSKTNFEDFLVAHKNCKTIQFRNCYLTMDDQCDFSDKLDGCTFETLSFQNSGASGISNWIANDFAAFKNIVTGLAVSDNISLRNPSKVRNLTSQISTPQPQPLHKFFKIVFCLLRYVKSTFLLSIY